MEYLNFKTLIILCPLLFFAGFVDSIGGGGGLISLPAFLFAGLPVHTAIGTNKLQSTFGTFISTFRFIRHGYVSFKLIIPSIITAFIGSALGSRLTLFFSEKQLSYIMIVVLPISALLVLNKKLFNVDLEQKITYNRKTYITTSISSLIIGCYDGFYGPGTGTFLILAFTILAKMNAVSANANAKVINLTTNFASLIVFLLSGKTIMALGLIGALFNMAGNYVGSGFVIADAQKIMRPVIIFVLLLLTIKIIGGF
ncbi:TSUP family transporter [Anaerosphaera multitolerans]|uniref:TSUP family transporter n=1 Tax=Anaerosphaera multitolerans TaxID=2487351 RepID=UPI00196A8D41|nr:TSUP family transporter [Anaerosphaera multitolerans]